MPRGTLPSSTVPHAASAVVVGDGVPRVLVVDDLADNLFALRRLLEREPYEVDLAPSAEQALRMMLEHDYACVLCDIQMPWIDGLEFIRIVREDPDLHRVPITFVTAHGFEAPILKQAARYDAFDLVTKPVEPEVLRSKLRVFVQLQRQRVQLRRQAEQLLEDQRALRALNDELARSNSTLEQYAYLASHDLRAPLRRLTALCGILTEDHASALDDDGRACIDQIDSNAARMRDIVDDLLRLARLDTEAIRWSRCDLNVIVEDAVAALDHEARQAGVRIDVGPLPTIRSDAGWLRHLVHNLVSNAIRYRSGAAPCARIRGECVDGDFLLHVEDNGIGIAAEDTSAIFEPFRTLHPAEPDSRGLGLSIADRIVSRLGARIDVRSAVGRGSTFTVRFGADCVLAT